MLSVWRAQHTRVQHGCRLWSAARHAQQLQRCNISSSSSATLLVKAAHHCPAIVNATSTAAATPQAVYVRWSSTQAIQSIGGLPLGLSRAQQQSCELPHSHGSELLFGIGQPSTGKRTAAAMRGAFLIQQDAAVGGCKPEELAIYASTKSQALKLQQQVDATLPIGMLHQGPVSTVASLASEFLHACGVAGVARASAALDDEEAVARLQSLSWCSEAHLLSSNQAKALLSRNLHALPLPWHGNHFRRGQFTAALSQQFRLLAACGVSASDYLAYTRVLAEYCDTEEQQQLLQQHKAVAEAAAAWSAIKEEANACELSDTMLAALRVAQAMPTLVEEFHTGVGIKHAIVSLSSYATPVESAAALALLQPVFATSQGDSNGQSLAIFADDSRIFSPLRLTQIMHQVVDKIPATTQPMQHINEFSTHPAYEKHPPPLLEAAQLHLVPRRTRGPPAKVHTLPVIKLPAAEGEDGELVSSPLAVLHDEQGRVPPMFHFRFESMEEELDAVVATIKERLAMPSPERGSTRGMQLPLPIPVRVVCSSRHVADQMARALHNAGVRCGRVPIGDVPEVALVVAMLHVVASGCANATSMHTVAASPVLSTRYGKSTCMAVSRALHDHGGARVMAVLKAMAEEGDGVKGQQQQQQDAGLRRFVEDMEWCCEKGQTWSATKLAAAFLRRVGIAQRLRSPQDLQEELAGTAVNQLLTTVLPAAAQLAHPQSSGSDGNASTALGLNRALRDLLQQRQGDAHMDDCDVMVTPFHVDATPSCREAQSLFFVGMTQLRLPGRARVPLFALPTELMDDRWVFSRPDSPLFSLEHAAAASVADSDNDEFTDRYQLKHWFGTSASTGAMLRTLRSFVANAAGSQHPVIFTSASGKSNRARPSQLIRGVPAAVVHRVFAHDAAVEAGAVGWEEGGGVADNSGGAADVPDWLFTEDGALKVSASRLFEYNHCAHRFYLSRVAQVSTPSSLVMAQGTALHAAVAESGRWMLDGKSLEDEEKIVEACMREYTKAWEEGGFDAQWSQDAAFMLDKSHAYVRAFVARDVAAARIARDPSKHEGTSTVATPLLIEHTCVAKLKVGSHRVQLTGVVDRVDAISTQGGSGRRLHVREFKSNRLEQAAKSQAALDREARQSTQLQMYSLALLDEMGELPALSTIEGIENNTVGACTPDLQHVSHGMSAIGAFADGVVAGRWEASPSFHKCSFCDLAPLCSHRDSGVSNVP